MAGFSVIAAALTDHSTRKWSLTIAGVDVILQPGAPANVYGVRIETVNVTEAGPGAVSSCTFTIADPAGVVPYPAEMAPVTFWDIAKGYPDFDGFIQGWSSRPTAANGRFIDVRCVGIEAVLDWMNLPALTLPSGMNALAAIQSVIGNANGVGVQLRAFADPISGTHGSQAFPISGPTYTGQTLQYAVVIADGTTLRDALAQVQAAAWFAYAGVVLPGWATVDFYHGLRVGVYITSIFTYVAGDLVFDAPGDVPQWSTQGDVAHLSAAAADAGSLNYEFDALGVYHQVYVIGGNAAGTGVVSDGTGIVGPIATVSDSSSTTVAQKLQVGAAYLAQQSARARGSMTFSPILASLLTSTPPRPYGTVSTADAQFRAGSFLWNVNQISKTFRPNGYEYWTVGIGGTAPSMARQMRRATRGTRS